MVGKQKNWVNTFALLANRSMRIVKTPKNCVTSAFLVSGDVYTSWRVCGQRILRDLGERTFFCCIEDVIASDRRDVRAMQAGVVSVACTV